MARTHEGKFAKGSSGNPGGRPIGSAVALAKRLRERTNNLQTVADMMVDVMMGNPLPGSGRVPEPALQVDAAKWIADRVAGKAAQIIDLTTHGDDNHSENFRMSPEALARLEAVLESVVEDGYEHVPSPSDTEH